MCFLGTKYAKNVFTAGALPGIPLGELTARILQRSPGPSSWI